MKVQIYLMPTGDLVLLGEDVFISEHWQTYLKNLSQDKITYLMTLIQGFDLIGEL